MLKVTRSQHVLEVSFEGRRDGNLMTWDVLRELRDFALDHHDDTDTRAIVLGGKARTFTSGFDLATGVQAFVDAASLSELRALNRLGSQMCAAWERLPCFTVAAIEGLCVGGGAALALACDARVAGEGGRFYIPEILRGMNLGWGAVPRLVNLVGPGRAKQMCILPQPLGAPMAHRWGLVERVVPEGEAMAAAREMAAEAAGMPPVAVQMIKRSIDAYANALAELGSFADGDQMLLLTKSADFGEGVASFMDRRPGIFTGR